jgi:cellobiose phosphorylase
MGEVKYPGTYTLLRKDEKISSVIKRAGGLTNYAYMDGVKMFRKFEVVEDKVDENIKISDELNAQFHLKLKPNEERSFQVVVGYTFDSTINNIDTIAKELYSTEEKGSNKFADEWLEVLPSFPNEKDEVLKREMVWNAYNLEAMATYSQFYEETKIPQGTAYDYDWGIHASARDNFQHALPLPHYNPKLAKSVLRYMMKRTTPWGNIRLIEYGNGFSSSWHFLTSDQQLFSFMLLAEYLRVTSDYDVLIEKTSFYPYKNMPEATLLDCVEAQFQFLRDEVGIGEHGLVRLLNSDLNDAIYHIVKEPYNDVLYTGESHMNSAMAISILDDLIPQLKKAKDQSSLSNITRRLGLLIQSMKLYRDGIYDAFMKDLGDSKFPKRFYFNGKVYGEENMFLEPQGYTLQINDLSTERKKILSPRSFIKAS